MRNRHQSNSSTGLTLIELVLVLSVLAILLSAAFPGLRTVLARNQLIGQANELAGALALARNEAATRSQQVGFCVSPDGEDCGWPEANATEYFLLVFIDANANFNRNDDAEPLKVLPGNPDVGFVLAEGAAQPPDAFYFNPSGFFTRNANANLLVCHREGADLQISDRCRAVTVSPTGSVAVRQHEETGDEEAG